MGYKRLGHRPQTHLTQFVGAEDTVSGDRRTWMVTGSSPCAISPSSNNFRRI